MNQPDPNAEVAPQLQATIASMLDALESSPPSALLEEAHPDLAPEQREKVWGDMLRNYAKDREAGKFSAFELDREHLEATGELSKRDQARRQLYEHIATAHGQKLNWLSESQAAIKPRRPDPAEAGTPDEVLDMRERWVTDTSAWEQSHEFTPDPTEHHWQYTVSAAEAGGGTGMGSGTGFVGTGGVGGQPPMPPTPPPPGGPSDDENERERRRQENLRLKVLRETQQYQRIYGTHPEEWTREDLEIAGEVQAERLTLEPPPFVDVEAEVAAEPPGRTRRERRKYAEEARHRQLEEAAAMESAAPGFETPLGQDRTPPPRNAWQRARMVAQEAGFIQPEDVPEQFQTDEWRAANAPLSQGERFQFGLDAAAVATFGWLGRQAVRGATSLVTDEGTEQVLGDVAGTASQGLGNIAAGATAGARLGGPKGAAIGAVIGASATIATLPQKVIEWGQALVDSRQHLVMWSGMLQSMKRESELRGVARDIESARETAPYASTLNSQLQDVYDQLRPIKDDVYKIVTILASAGVGTLSKLLQAQEKLGVFGNSGLFALQQIAKVADWWMGHQTPEDTTVQAWARAWTNAHIPSARVPRR